MNDYLGKIYRHFSRILNVAIPGKYRFQIYFNKYIASKFSDKIISGPFCSVYYLCNNIPKKLGTYEKELHTQILDMIKNDKLDNPKDIVFLHTGGAPAIHSFADLFLDLEEKINE